MVSVIIPNYNHSRYLPDRISSVREQTLTGFECLVLDDCSIDNSRDIIDQAVSNDNRFKKLYNDVNSGSTFVQWNRGVKATNGHIIWIAESDDKAEPLLLERLIKCMDDPDVVIAYCQSYKINSEGRVAGTWEGFTEDLDTNVFSSDFTMEGSEYIERFLIHRNTIPNASAVVFRKSHFERVGGAPERLKNNGDWLTWLKMLCFGKVAYVSEPLNMFRYHENSVIAKLRNNADATKYNEQYDCAMREAFDKFIKCLSMSNADRIIKINRKYISFDKGNEGLFDLRNRKYLKGWSKILYSTVYPSFKTGFLKKALKMT